MSAINLDEGRRLLREATPGWRANHANAYSVVSSQSHPVWELSADRHRQISDGNGGYYIGKDRELLLWLYKHANELLENFAWMESARRALLRKEGEPIADWAARSRAYHEAYEQELRADQAEARAESAEAALEKAHGILDRLRVIRDAEGFDGAPLSVAQRVSLLNARAESAECALRKAVFPDANNAARAHFAKYGGKL